MYKQLIVSILLFFLLSLSSCFTALSRPVVELVTGELEPYIGNELVNKGYVYQLVTEAYSRAGYDVRIKFYPWARAQSLVRSGLVDGIVPLYRHAAEKGLLLSKAFPGGTVGLLKHKDNPQQYAISPTININQALQSLDNAVVGTVRGGLRLPALEKHLKTEPANSDLQNLDKLVHRRFPYIFIDKYTAVDLMVGNRPHYIGLLEFMQPALAKLDFYLAISTKAAKSKQLIAAFNLGLAEMLQDGTVSKLQQEHGLLLSSDFPNDQHKLTIGVVNNPDMQIMRRIATQYTAEHPGIELEWNLMEENTLRRRLQGDLAIADGLFDVISIGNYEAPIWGERGWLKPFESFPKSYHVEDIFAPNIEALSHQQQVYALPFYAETIVTYYRKDWFAEAGLTMPSQPSFADIRHYAELLHRPEQGRYGICLRGKAGWGENIAIFTSWLHAMGGRWFDLDWQPQLLSPAWRKVLAYYIDLITNYAQPEATTKGYPDLLSLFANGHCAIWIDASVAAATLFNPQLSEVSEQVAISAAPHAQEPSHWLWVWSLAIPSSSKQTQAAKDFILWATSREYIKLVARQEGWFSVPPGTRLSTYASPQYQASAVFSTDIFRALVSINMRARSRQSHPYTGMQYVGIDEFSSFGDRVGYLIHDVVRGKLSQQQALEEAQSLLNNQMLRSRYFQ